jgi:N-acetylmuramoyl-L-alanine amidase
MKILRRPLPYAAKLTPRPLTDIDTVVIHCTELPDMATARQFGEKIHYASGTGNSGHFYISKSGQVEQWVDENRIANHVAGHNLHTIGIELDNRGRYPHWFDSRYQQPNDPYTDAQITALIALLQHLQQKLPALQYIAGHEDLDQRRIAAEDRPEVMIRRKIDPGPLFPWEKVMASIRLINIGQQPGNTDTKGARAHE